MQQLRPIEFHVLLALVSGPLHGYGLVRRIAEQSEGRLSVLPGNLYTVLRRLDGQGWVSESATRPSAGDDPRRRYFELSPAGRVRLEKEATHMQSLLDRLGGLPLAPVEEKGGRP